MKTLIGVPYLYLWTCMVFSVTILLHIRWYIRWTQSGDALHIMQFLVPIYPWNARLLIQMRCKLWTRPFLKELEPLPFTKISLALCSRRTLLEMNEGDIASSHEVGWWPLFKLALELRKRKTKFKRRERQHYWKDFSILAYTEGWHWNHLLTGTGRRMIEVHFSYLGNFDHQKIFGCGI